MSLTESKDMAMGTPAPNFNLPNTIDGKLIELKTYAANKPLLIAFICNHCPYVLHIIEQFTDVANRYQKKGIACVAISANDITSHPQDAPDKMLSFANTHGFEFPYCFDESQAVAKAYQASCTPDIYLFNQAHLLVYHGQFDNASPGNDEAVTGNDLRQAMDCLLQNKPMPAVQHPCMGCNIKWRE